MLFSSRDGDHVQMGLPDYAGLSMPRGSCSRSLPDTPRPHGRAMPAPHSSTRCYRRKNGPQGQTRRAGSPPADVLLVPRERSGSQGLQGEREVSNIFGGISLRVVFSCPLFEVSIVWKSFFSRSGTLSPPPGDFIFVSPGILAQVRCPHVCRSSLAYCRFFFFFVFARVLFYLVR